MPLSFMKSGRKLSRMLQNTLEMTQDYYSTAVQRRALETLNSAWRVDSWQSASYRLTTERCKSYVPETPGYTDSKEAIHFHILCMTIKRLLGTRQLSNDEVSMLWDLAKRRGGERYTAELNPDRVRILYEVELFSLCAGQDSRFRGDIKNLREWSDWEWVANSHEICDGIVKLMFDVLRYGFQPYVDYCREEMSEPLSRIATPLVDRPMAAQGEPQD
ncbi:hypothetical protein BU17DRAFT_68701 [Hysterangium stoloniferum]|nr:hypothetical protein BU17DRAFT_68701 [Hysterangium stoloniferum]